MNSSRTTSNKDLKNHVYTILKERLIDCIYPPDSMLNEAQLASDLNLSRTPVREAISRLEMDGFIKIIPKKGIYVTNIDFHDVIQIFQTRLEIEPIALRLAAPNLPIEELINFRNKFLADAPNIRNSFRLDTAMHLFIVEHCGNKYIIEMMRKLFDDNTRVIIASKQNETNIHDAKQEHLDILNALIDTNFKSAEQLMRTHIETCRRAALDYFYSKPAYSSPNSEQYKQELAKIDLA